MSDLRACPFCGANVSGPFFREYVGDYRQPSWWLECNECPAGMEVDGEATAPLVAAWNRRTDQLVRGFKG